MPEKQRPENERDLRMRIAAHEGFIARLCGHYELKWSADTGDRLRAASDWLAELEARKLGLCGKPMPGDSAPPAVAPDPEPDWEEPF